MVYFNPFTDRKKMFCFSKKENKLKYINLKINLNKIDEEVP